jgi:hypothetical protein
VLTRKVSSAKLRPQLTRLLSICSRSERVSLQTSQSEKPLSRGQILAKLLKAGWKQEHLESFSLIRVFRVKVLKSFGLL